MWKQAIAAKIKILTWHKNLPAKIQTSNLPITT
jgi:hypothetical protein